MSDFLYHECGIAVIRLLKPLTYYQKKYGTSFYAMNKLYLLMEKLHNRGQDEAGVANIKFDAAPEAATSAVTAPMISSRLRTFLIVLTQNLKKLRQLSLRG